MQKRITEHNSKVVQSPDMNPIEYEWVNWRGKTTNMDQRMKDLRRLGEKEK